MQETIHGLIREAEDNFIDNPVEISEYVSFDMHDTINTIDAYLNSRHISGEKDALGRDKPFFNIVSAAVNIWYRATDIDRKNIRILPSNSKTVAHAFVATVLLQQWMRDARFGVFLNDWGRALARYGSAVCKFVEKDGELIASVVPWNRMIVDPIDFDALPRIEKFYLTPAQLMKNKNYDQDVVKGLLDARQTRENLDGTDKDQQNHFIELYEVHGELPDYMLKDEPAPKDETEVNYVQQMHVVSYTQNKDGSYDDYTLYKGREAKDPYMITHLIKEDGRTLSIGAVEYLFNSQWMVNHAQKNIKDTLDIASKLIMQTADKKFVGRNILTGIETGDIFVHEPNAPMTRVANDKPDITALQNFKTDWQNLSSELTSTPDAIRGNTMPSGTPYSLAAYSGAQANSLFEIMTENKGLHLEDMLREYILPNLKKKMNSKKEVVAVLDDNSIAEIDAMYVPAAAVKAYNEEFKEKLLNLPDNLNEISEEDLPTEYNPQEAEAKIKQGLAPLGNKRTIKPDDLDEKSWNDVLKDFEMNVIVEVTNEATDKQAVLTTLSTVLQTISSNPLVLQDPNAKMVFNAILTETGKLSPIQLSTAASPSASPPQGDGRELEALTQNNNERTATSTT